MKKLLLATTALVASTGLAMADGNITMSGSASAGLLDNGTDGFEIYNGADVSFTVSGASDSGLEYGTSLKIKSTDGTRDGFGEEAAASGASGGAVWISGGGLKVTFDNGGISDLYDGSGHDLSINFTAGDLTIDATNDVDGSSATSTSVKVGYSAGDLSFALATNDTSNAEIDLGYDVGDLSFDLNHDTAGSGTSKVTVGFSASDDVSVTASVDSDSGWTASATFAAGDASISVSTDNASAWKITGSMDGGGGLTLEAGINHASAMYAGAKMTF